MWIIAIIVIISVIYRLKPILSGVYRIIIDLLEIKLLLRLRVI